MKSKPFKPRSLFEWILLILTIGAVVCLFVSYAAYYTPPRGKYAYIAFFGLAYPIILLVNFLFLFTWLFLWRRFFWIPLIAILLGFNHMAAIIQLNISPEKTTAGSKKVMTFNVHNLSGVENDVANDKNIRAKVLDFLRKEQPEILCCQEFRIQTKDTTFFIKEIFHSTNLRYFHCKNYKLRLVRTTIDALATFTSIPIIGSGELEFPEEHTFALYTDVVIDGDKVRIYNVHLESIRLGEDDLSLYSNLSSLNAENQDLKSGLRRMVLKFRKAFIKRAQQVAVLEKSMKESPFPVIVCGDFNDTPSSYSYNTLTNNLDDTFRKAGGGFLSSTYAGNFPSFRIDYILINEKFKAYEYQKYDISLSDHYPVSVYVNFAPAK